MALIKIEHFTRVNKERNTIHKPTSATFTVFEKDDRKYFQIDTYGSEDRIMTEKVSQSIQLDKTMAQKLIDILRREFLLD